MAEAIATAAAAAAAAAAVEEKEKLKWQEMLHYYSSTDRKEDNTKGEFIVIDA